MNPTQIVINANLPGTATNSSVPGLIANLYNFALIGAGILAFGAVIYGGIRYAAGRGNPSEESDAKNRIFSALLGLLLLGSAWVVLNTINPQLVSLSLPNINQTVTAPPAQSGTPLPASSSTSTSTATSTGSTASSTTSSTCNPPASGPCSIASLQNTCLANDAQQAGGICNRESGDNSNAQGDLCADGHYASIGLFQINISSARITDGSGNTLNCPSAFSSAFTATNHTCTVTNPTLYNQCLAAMETPAVIIANTCADTSNGTNWKYWSTSGSGCTINTSY